MNKLTITILAILGGIEIVFYIVTPILVSLIWVNISSFESLGTYVMYSAGLLASVFRGIKIGWLNK